MLGFVQSDRRTIQYTTKEVIPNKLRIPTRTPPMIAPPLVENEGASTADAVIVTLGGAAELGSD